MCGIVAWHRPGRPVDEKLLGVAVSRLAHRGPDGSGVQVCGQGDLGLGHRRLAVIDTSAAAAQPMTDEAGRYTITFNGEIYNYRELRTELGRGGYRFLNASDTEVILAAYAAWGTGCLKRLTGMFAFALFDHAANTLLIARDRAGEKPLFYHLDAGGLALASELKALFELVTGERKIAPQCLDEYLAWGYVGGGRCLLQGFNKLPPGSYGVYDLASAKLSISKYWSPPQRTTVAGDAGIDDLSREFEGLLEAAVHRQLVADVPLGVFLSGGVDSSVIAALARRASAKVRTFTITFPDVPALDEGRHARRVAQFLETDHTEIPVGEIDGAFIDELVVQFDEPIADPSIVPTAVLSRASRSHVTVALGGDGADELLGGYPQYRRLAAIDAWRRCMPVALRQNLAGRLSEFSLSLPGSNTVSSLFDEPGSIGRFNVYFTARGRSILFPVRERSTYDPEDARDEMAARELPAGERASRADFESYLPDELLVKVDRASMMFSLEVRAPFLDRDVIEFAMARVPWRFKVGPHQQKILLNSLAKRVLPPDFDVMRKQGFTPPMASWLQGALSRDVAAMVSHLGSIGFDPAVLRLIVDNPHRHANRLFLLMMLSKWMRHYKVSL